jgi:predicted RNA-binding protein YlqC (UPF0109 family)
MNDEELDKELRNRRWQGQLKSELQPDDGDLEIFFRDLVGSYLNFPAYLKLELKEAQRFWALMVEPDVSDYAIVAGKLGRNFNALRTLVQGIGAHQKMHIELSLEGPPKEDQRYIRKQLPYRVNLQWRPDTLKSIVSRTLRLAGMAHVRMLLQKNRTVDESNPFDDQTFFWFIGQRDDREREFAYALGQLVESMGIAQGQRLTPKTQEYRSLEKTA